MGKWLLKDRSFLFAIKVVKIMQFLQEDKKEYVLSKQLLRSGTAIGALIREAEFGESKADFIHKLNIALKEANETEYWLCILNETDYISKKDFDDIQNECKELISMLVATVKSMRKVRS